MSTPKKSTKKTQPQKSAKQRKIAQIFSHLPKNRWGRLVLAFVTIVILITAVNYGVARWYQHTQAGKPYSLGVTYISGYAASFGLDPRETLGSILDDLGARQLRLVSYWSVIEREKGHYDFSDLDWQMQAAEKHGAKVSLAIGLRQPRWPECHSPKWVDTSQPREQWQPALEDFMTAVVDRYKDSPSLESYQLENEFYNSVFGECYNADRDRLADELDLVHRLDSKHPVIISRSNNTPTLMLRAPVTDLNAFTLYRKVYDSTITKRYFTYPMPPWHYSAIAGWQKIIGGQDSIIHELQAEPWPPSGQGGIKGISLAEQDQTLSAKRLRANVEFAKNTGMRHIDLWGAEYWYYRKVKLHDPSVWDEAKLIFAQ